MSGRLNFTTERLAKLTCPPGKDRQYFKDAKLPGLVVCVTRTGAKTFFVYKRLNGKPTRYRLGLWPQEFGVDDARKAATKANHLIVQGIDPRQEKRERRAELTFAELFAEKMEETKAKRRQSTCREYERQFNSYLKPWHARRLSEIRHDDVKALHRKLGNDHGVYLANRVLALVHKLFKGRPSNPAHGVEKFREQSRERFLAADELPRWFAAVGQEEEPFADFFTLALWTGARRANLQAMKWADVHLERAVWTIPPDDAKAGKPINVHLSQEAIVILAKRLLARDGSEYVFPSHGKSGHLQEPKGAWARVLDRAGITGLRIHDLRRSLGSWQAATGASLPIIGKSLGHANPSTTAIYARLTMDPVAESVNKATSAMMNVVKAAKEKEASNVD